MIPHASEYERVSVAALRTVRKAATKKLHFCGARNATNAKCRVPSVNRARYFARRFESYVSTPRSYARRVLKKVLRFSEIILCRSVCNAPTPTFTRCVGVTGLRSSFRLVAQVVSREERGRFSDVPETFSSALRTVATPRFLVRSGAFPSAPSTNANRSDGPRLSSRQVRPGGSSVSVG